MIFFLKYFEEKLVTIFLKNEKNSIFGPLFPKYGQMKFLIFKIQATSVFTIRLGFNVFWFVKCMKIRILEIKIISI